MKYIKKIILIVLLTILLTGCVEYVDETEYIYTYIDEFGNEGTSDSCITWFGQLTCNLDGGTIKVSQYKKVLKNEVSKNEN